MSVSELHRACYLVDEFGWILSFDEPLFKQFNCGLIVSLCAVCACILYAFTLDESFVLGFGVVGGVVEVLVEFFWFL